MAVRCSAVVSSIVAAAMMPLGARAETLGALSAPTRNTVACMVAVLKEMPGVRGVETGVVRGANFATLTRTGRRPAGLHPYIEYTVSDGSARQQGIRFTGDIDPDAGRDRYYFWTSLPGLSTPGTAPSDWGTGSVETAWKSRCRANATGIFN